MITRKVGHRSNHHSKGKAVSPANRMSRTVGRIKDPGAMVSPKAEISARGERAGPVMIKDPGIHHRKAGTSSPVKQAKISHQSRMEISHPEVEEKIETVTGIEIVTGDQDLKEGNVRHKTRRLNEL